MSEEEREQEPCRGCLDTEPGTASNEKINDGVREGKGDAEQTAATRAREREREQAALQMQRVIS